MNKKIQLLLSAVLLASASVFAASTATAGQYNRTAMLFPNVNTAAESCFGRLKNAEKSDDAFGLCVGGVGYWHQILPGANSGLELAKGFSPAGENNFPLVTDHFLVNLATGAGVSNLTMNFDKVEHRRIGAVISACYALDNIYDGLYVGGNVGVLHERNSLSFTVTNGTGAGATHAADFVKFLKGEYTASQAALSNLRMESGKAMSNTGINNVDVYAGLKVVNTDNASVCVKLVATAPTGNKMENVNLFQPNAGVRNAKFGVAVAAMVKLINDDSYALNFAGDLQWQYGIKRTDAYIPTHKAGFGHYKAFVKVGDTAATPLANVLAGMKAEVESRNEVNALAKVSFEKGIVGVDLGYNMYFSQEKNLVLKDFPTIAWYGLTSAGSDALPTAYVAIPADILAAADLGTTYPQHLEHKGFVGVNALFSEWEFPMLVGAMVSYSYSATPTVTPRYWGVSLRAGVSF